MTTLVRILFPLLCTGIAALTAGTKPDIRAALDKNDVTILITDSGLGGVSVAADFEKQLRLSRIFRNASIVFCNALPGDGKGYNDMPDEREKARVFSAALDGMVQRYKPDVIVIACNTLSVVYDRTEFSQRTAIPVVGIVDCAVELFVRLLTADPSSLLLLFGTETTIGSQSHRQKLIAAGIPEQRIAVQACPKLESEIQTDPSGDMTRTYIDWYVNEAVPSLPAAAPAVYAGLCCTHYGFSASIFQEALRNAGIKHPVIVNPNEAMAKSVLPERKVTFPSSSVAVSVVSRAVISAEEIASIAALIERDSPATAAALKTYRRRHDLFTVPMR